MQAETPDIDESLDWIWRAWQRLSHDRPWLGGGMGPAVPGRIPWSVVRAWSRYHALSRGEMKMLDHCFGEMDAVYIEHMRLAQSKPENPSA